MNSEKPVLSVVIPCYNGERCLPHLLEQVCAENLDGVEVLIINDGSTDGTENVCRLYSQRNSHIAYITTENRGVSAARNLGTESAHGEYITFFDADDEIVGGGIALYKEKIISADDVYIFRYENEKRYAPHLDSQIFAAEYFLELFLSFSVNIGVYSFILKKTFLSKNNIAFERGMKFGEDYLFIFTVLFACGSIVYEDSAVYRYLINENSVSAKSNYDSSRFLAFIKIKEFLDSKISEKSSLLKAYNFFLADLYCANVQIYLQSGKKSKEFELRAKFYKSVLKKHFCGFSKRLLRILFFKIVPLKLLFLIKKGGTK